VRRQHKGGVVDEAMQGMFRHLRRRNQRVDGAVTQRVETLSAPQREVQEEARA